MKHCELAVIGAGPAGLAAALSAYENGVKDIIIFERDEYPGGILNQCIHSGFGLRRFNEELTGPEYAERFIKKLENTGVTLLTETTVTGLTKERVITAVSPTGLIELSADAVILAMGCRERPRGAISIPGSRCSGILTAGAAQRYMNVEGYMVGKRVVILGSGDIGLIMARRLTLEGAKVLACVELMPYSSGLTRNIVQCLNDFDIPLMLSHTVTDVRGKNRVEQVVVSKVGPDRKPIPGTEITFDCDTLLLSVGLIPENELTKNAGIPLDRRTRGAFVCENCETLAPGIFACGNVLQVHDLVDFVSEEAEKAGKSAAKFIQGERAQSEGSANMKPGSFVSYVVPQRVRKTAEPATLSFRVSRSFENGYIRLSSADGKQAVIKRARMVPGEMQRVVLPARLLEISTEITVSCEDGPLKSGMEDQND